VKDCKSGKVYGNGGPRTCRKDDSRTRPISVYLVDTDFYRLPSIVAGCFSPLYLHHIYRNHDV
jgi:hypothetical protein